MDKTNEIQNLKKEENKSTFTSSSTKAESIDYLIGQIFDLPIVKELKVKVDNIYSTTQSLLSANELDSIRNELTQLHDEINKLTDEDWIKNPLDDVVNKIIGSEAEQTNFANSLNKKYQELQKKVQEFIELATEALEKSQDS